MTVDGVWLARNGVPISMRRIGAHDLERLRAFVQALSLRTAYQRLLSPRTPTEDELRHWTDVDPSREAALVATVMEGGSERFVGVARYVRDGAPGDAEFAIVLADAWQGCGLGAELLRRLMEMARSDGIGRLFGTALSTNTAMLALARRLGFRVRRSPDSALLTLVETAGVISSRG